MPFERTVDILLRLVARSQQADVATLSRFDSSATPYARWVSVQLHGPHHLFLGWHQSGAALDLSTSAPLIAALNSILALNDEEALLHELLANTATLQWKLADAKFADRTAGLMVSGGADPSKVEEQITKMLASIENVGDVRRRMCELNSELEDRKLIAAAKALLQARHGLTEQQAYARLHQTSRRTRLPISQVARKLCSDDEVNAKRIA